MDVVNLAKELVRLLNKSKFKNYYDNEIPFEKDVYDICKKYLGKRYKDLDKIIVTQKVTHGKIKDRKRLKVLEKLWKKSKAKQNVIIAGSPLLGRLIAENISGNL